MPYTTTFPPGLPADLEQILRDLHASKKFRLPTSSCTDWLYTHLMLCQPNLGHREILHYHIYLILMVRALRPSVQSFHPSFHQGHKLPSSIALPTTKCATCLFTCCDHSFYFFLSFFEFSHCSSSTLPLTLPLLDRDIPYSFSFPQPHLTQALVFSLSFRPLFALVDPPPTGLLAASTAPPPRQAVFNPNAIPVSPPPGNVRPQPHRQPELLWLHWMICLAAWATEALCAHPIVSQEVPPDEYFETISARNIYIQMRRAIHEFNILQRRIARGISLLFPLQKLQPPLDNTVSTPTASSVHWVLQKRTTTLALQLMRLYFPVDNRIATSTPTHHLSHRLLRPLQLHHHLLPHRHLHALDLAHLPRLTSYHHFRVRLPLPLGPPPPVTPVARRPLLSELYRTCNDSARLH